MNKHQEYDDAATLLEILPEKIRLRQRALTEARFELELAEGNPDVDGGTISAHQRQVRIIGFDIKQMEERLQAIRDAANGTKAEVVAEVAPE